MEDDASRVKKERFLGDQPTFKDISDIFNGRCTKYDYEFQSAVLAVIGVFIMNMLSAIVLGIIDPGAFVVRSSLGYLIAIPLSSVLGRIIGGKSNIWMPMTILKIMIMFNALASWFYTGGFTGWAGMWFMFLTMFVVLSSKKNERLKWLVIYYLEFAAIIIVTIINPNLVTTPPEHIQKYSSCALIFILSAYIYFMMSAKQRVLDSMDAENQKLAEGMLKKNDELSLLNEELDNANKAKSAFLANMSHEIRTPINAVLGMNTMVLRKATDSEIRKYANDIQGAGKSLLSIINDILDFSKIEAGKMEIVPVDYDFSSLINDVYNMINNKAEDKCLTFEMDIDDTLPCRLFGDDVRIRQILVNLLTNAVKYTPKGKVTLRISKIMNNVGDGMCSLQFEVCDTGIGIKPEDISKLTEEFVRIEESRNRNIEGTGLGINIVVSLLDLMGSKLEVSSVYGEGSVFSFILNQRVTNDEAIGDISERINNIGDVDQDYKIDFCIPNAKMLVVDDNSMNLTVFSSLLGDMKCHIDEADSGEKCLSLVQKNKYDIIFLDHMMPGMDGIETFHHMKEFGDYINSETPVIILTANAISGAKEEYLAAGFDDYLSKPIEIRTLNKLLKRFIPEDYFEEYEAVNSDIEKKDNSFSDETLSALDGIIDLKTGYSYAGNKKKSYDTIIKSYVKKSMDRIPYIQKVYAKNDWSNYVIEVHALKSSSLTIGAVNLSELAKELELSGKSGDYDIILDKNDLLITLYKDAVEAAKVYIRNEIDEDEESEAIKFTKDELKALLGQIVEATDAFDSDTVLELISDKKCSEYNGDNLDEFFSTIEESVNDFNYESVLESIEDFRTKYELEE